MQFEWTQIHGRHRAFCTTNMLTHDAGLFKVGLRGGMM